MVFQRPNPLPTLTTIEGRFIPDLMLLAFNFPETIRRVEIGEDLGKIRPAGDKTCTGLEVFTPAQARSREYQERE